MSAKHPYRYRWRTVALVLGLVVISGAAHGASCPDRLLSPAGQSTAKAIETSFRGVGVTRMVRGGYVVTDQDGSHHAATLPDIYAILATTLSQKTDNRNALEIYFENLNKREAWNVISTLRLKAGAHGQEIHGFAYTGGGGSPPRPPNDSVAVSPAPRDHNNGNEPGHGNGLLQSAPSSGSGSPPQGPPHEPLAASQAPKNGGGGNLGGGRSGASQSAQPWAAAVFKPLGRRYDWTKATVEELKPVRANVFSRDFDPLGYSFRVVIPATKEEKSRPRFDVSVLFQKLTAKPPVSEVKDTVETALRDEAMKRATVQRAARRVIDRIQTAYPNAKAAVDVLDLLIVDLEHDRNG